MLENFVQTYVYVILLFWMLSLLLLFEFKFYSVRIFWIFTWFFFVVLFIFRCSVKLMHTTHWIVSRCFFSSSQIASFLLNASRVYYKNAIILCSNYYLLALCFYYFVNLPTILIQLLFCVFLSVDRKKKKTFAEFVSSFFALFPFVNRIAFIFCFYFLFFISFEICFRFHDRDIFYF